jgi:CDP-diacylglycerol---serine O-phosphatidyltransferase
MVYSLCGILRLVRFSVKKPIERKGNIIEMTEKKKHFTGLPITAAAAASVSVNLLFLSPFIRQFIQFNEVMRSIVLSVIMMGLGYLMVCRWKFPSMKGLRLKVHSFHLVFFIIVIVVGVLYGILYYFPIVLAFFSWGYIVLAVILTIIRKIAGKKSKTLEDFEPEEEDDDE